MRKIISVFLFAVCAGNLFCASAREKEPEWVSAPKNIYSADQYFSYVGKSKNRAQAELLAVEGIAAVFEQKINSASTVSSRMEKAGSEGKVAVAKVQNFSSKIMRSVDVDSLVGVELKEFWTDGEKNVYALAVLDKQKAAELYSGMIQKNNGEISKLLNVSTDDEFSLENYARIDFAREISCINEKYLSRLSVVDFSKASELEKKTVSSAEINSRLLEIARQIPVYVYFKNDPDGRVQAGCSRILSSFGFRTSQDKNERYSFTGDLEFKQNVPKDKSSVQCRYFFKAVLNDSAFEQNLFALSFDGRSASNTYDNALVRAFSAIDSRAESEFKKFLQNIAVHY
ncbi:hypothetical protein [Treponema sp.]|uniref:hypothetical protein n=1 Tax=Treponema sp. TaxID=166 RepID=UPI003F0BD813